MEEKTVYSPQEVANYLKVSIYTVVRKLNSGELHGKKVGTLWRILGEDIIKYMKGTR